MVNKICDDTRIGEQLLYLCIGSKPYTVDHANKLPYPKQVTVKDAVPSDAHNKFLSAAFFTVRVNNQWKEAFHNCTNNPLFLENSVDYMVQNILHFTSMHGSQTMIG